MMPHVALVGLPHQGRRETSPTRPRVSGARRAAQRSVLVGLVSLGQRARGAER